MLITPGEEGVGWLGGPTKPYIKHNYSSFDSCGPNPHDYNQAVYLSLNKKFRGSKKIILLLLHPAAPTITRPDQSMLVCAAAAYTAEVRALECCSGGLLLLN